MPEGGSITEDRTLEVESGEDRARAHQVADIDTLVAIEQGGVCAVGRSEGLEADIDRSRKADCVSYSDSA